jgi:hypothetical protein
VKWKADSPGGVGAHPPAEAGCGALFSAAYVESVLSASAADLGDARGEGAPDRRCRAESRDDVVEVVDLEVDHRVEDVHLALEDLEEHVVGEHLGVPSSWSRRQNDDAVPGETATTDMFWRETDRDLSKYQRGRRPSPRRRVGTLPKRAKRFKDSRGRADL